VKDEPNLEDDDALLASHHEHLLAMFAKVPNKRQNDYSRPLHHGDEFISDLFGNGEGRLFIENQEASS
jgi:hypothetical protein